MVARSSVGVALALCLAACGPSRPSGVARAGVARVTSRVEVRSVALALQIGHAKTVYDAAFSPDGSLVATGDAAGTVLVFSAATGEVQASFDAHEANVTSLAFSGDGALLASGGEDGRAVVLDLATGKELATTTSRDRKVWGVGFDADARLVVRDDVALTVRDSQSGALITDAGWSGADVRLSPAGDRLLVFDPRAVHFVETDTGRTLSRGDAEHAQPREGTFSPDGREAAVAFSEANHVSVFRVGTGEKKLELATAGRVVSVAWGGGVIAAAVEGVGVEVFDARDGHELTRIDAPRASAWLFGLTTDGARVVAAVSGTEIAAFDARTGARQGTLQTKKAIRRIVLDRTRGRVAVLYEHATDVDIWDGARVSCSRRGAPDDVRAASLFADGRSLAVVHEGDSTIVVHDLATGKVSSVAATGLDHVYEAIPSPDGKHLFATGYGESVVVGVPSGKIEARMAGEDGSAQFEGAWDPRRKELDYVGVDGHSIQRMTGQLVPTRRILRPGDAPTSLAFSRDGTLAVAGRAGVEIYAEGVLQRHFDLDVPEPAYGIAWSPDAKKIAVASERALAVFDATTGKHDAIDEGAFVSVAFSPDGSLIAAGERSGRVSIFETGGGARLKSLELHATPWSLGFLASAKRPVLVVAGGRLLLVRVDDGNTVRLRSFDVRGARVGLAIGRDAIAGDDAALALALGRTGEDVRSSLAPLPRELIHPSVALDLGR